LHEEQIPYGFVLDAIHHVEYKKESYVLFQDMMDRIEDETIRYLFFMQRSDTDATGGPQVPYPEVWADEEDEEEPEPVAVAMSEQRQAAQKAAQDSLLDLTRNIHRKKEKEMAQLQFVGGEASTKKQPLIAQKKPGRNDPCP